jgi:hypothetical protein
MTGTIESLLTGQRLGVIRAQNGTRFPFLATAVVGHQYDDLVIGQDVSFDLEARTPNAVRVQRELLLFKAAETDAPVKLRYMGFDQAKNIREYQFDGIANGQATQHFVITADLALFGTYHVAIQEGPALSMQKLSADLETPLQHSHELTGDDMQTYVTARAELAARRKTGSRKYRTPQKPEPGDGLNPPQ